MASRIAPAFSTGLNGVGAHVSIRMTFAFYMDRAGCLLLILLTLPVIVVAGLAVVLTSTGPVTTCSAAIGANGQTAFLHHFRTTYRYDRERAAVEGHRFGVTPVGWLLRWMRIARLPALADVWAGRIGLGDAICD